MRRRALWAGGATLALLGGAGLAWSRREVAPDRQAAAAAAFWSQSWDAPDGRRLAAAELRGRPLLLNFWATWCPPCIDELPLLDEFFRSGRERGWQVLGLAIDQPSAVRAFLGRQPLSVPVGLAGLGGTELARELGNEKGGLPFSVLFDREGRLVERKLGRLQAQDLQHWRGLA